MMMGGLPRPMIPGMSMDKFAVCREVQVERAVVVITILAGVAKRALCV